MTEILSECVRYFYRRVDRAIDPFRYFIWLGAVSSALGMIVWTGFGVGALGPIGMCVYLGVFIGLPALFVYKREKKSGEFDDKLNKERWRQGMEKFIEEVKKKK